MEHRLIHADKAPRYTWPGFPLSHHYPHAVRWDRLVFVSGQVGADPTTEQKVPGGIHAETRQALENVKAILETAGSSLRHTLKVNVFLQDLKADGAGFSEVYADYFPDPDNQPARTIWQASGSRWLVEIDVIAYVPEDRD